LNRRNLQKMVSIDSATGAAAAALLDAELISKEI
jgi:hypothetical protein